MVRSDADRGSSGAPAAPAGGSRPARRSALSWLLAALAVLLCAGLVGWMALAIAFSPVEPGWLRSGLAAAVTLGGIAALVRVRPLRRACAVIAATFAVVLIAWLAQAPSNERDWQTDVARLPWAEIEGDRVVVHDVRNADYRGETDFTVHWEERTLDLSRLRSLDLFLIYWGSPWIAHTIMSWGFDDGQYLAVSIETRKELGEAYSALRGFFRNYELVYVVADERDVVRLRTNFRGEDVYLYRLDVTPERARQLLLNYLEAVNALHDRAAWYNALTDNCTTTIQRLAGPYPERSWWSWRLLLNGRLDELGYENGALDQSLPFAELKSRSHVNERALAAGEDPDYSLRIRQGLPGMTEAPAT